MNWSAMPSDERLNLWKILRTDMGALPLNDQLELISEFCSTIVYGARSIDYYTPSSWPTPWEIFFHNSFCKNSVSLVIFHTLSMLGSAETVELWVVKDNEGDYLLPIINNQFILNYEPGKISNYPDVHNNFIVMQKFLQSEIKSIT